MRISFIGLHGPFLESYLELGIFKAARGLGSLQTSVLHLRDYALRGDGRVDDRPYGGGDGMVLRPEPLLRALEALPQPKPFVLFPGPRGRLFQQSHGAELAKQEHLCFVCGRFSGVDERFVENYVDQEFSIGDYVLSGGELSS